MRICVREKIQPIWENFRILQSLVLERKNPWDDGKDSSFSEKREIDWIDLPSKYK